jgi:ABC-type amino acid transport system permease subunit
VLLFPSHTSERGLQVLIVHSGAGMAETDGFGLDAVHEDDAHAGECIDIEFADRLRDHILPGKLLPIERSALVAQ